MVYLGAAILALLAAFIYQLVTGESVRSVAHRKLRPQLCRILGHRRSSRHTRKIESHYVSKCRNCGLPMEKPSRTADWKIVSRMPQSRVAVAEAPAAEPPAIDALPAAPAIRRGEPGRDAG